LFRWNSGYSAEQKTLRIPFRIILQRRKKLGILYRRTKNRSKLSEPRSKPFRGRETNSEFRSVEQEKKQTLGIPFRSMSRTKTRCQFCLRKQDFLSNQFFSCHSVPSTFFCGITETIPSLFRGIFSERNSVVNPSVVCNKRFCKKILLEECQRRQFFSSYFFISFTKLEIS
jgi:hypothetical protein